MGVKGEKLGNYALQGERAKMKGDITSPMILFRRGVVFALSFGSCCDCKKHIAGMITMRLPHPFVILFIEFLPPVGSVVS